MSKKSELSTQYLFFALSFVWNFSYSMDPCQYLSEKAELYRQRRVLCEKLLKKGVYLCDRCNFNSLGDFDPRESFCLQHNVAFSEALAPTQEEKKDTKFTFEGILIDRFDEICECSICRKSFYKEIHFQIHNARCHDGEAQYIIPEVTSYISNSESRL